MRMGGVQRRRGRGGRPHVPAGKSGGRPVLLQLTTSPKHMPVLANVDVLLAGSMIVFGLTPRPS